jgi:hypothetical protein
VLSLELSAGDPRIADAQAVASDMCWDQLKEAVIDRFIGDGPIYRQNTCPFLLTKKGALSGLSTRQCQSLKP